MKDEIKYEWCYETIEDGDIMECDFEDKLTSFTDNRKTDTLCLIRNVGNDIEGLKDRVYAYVKDNKLPEYFEESEFKVPAKFQKELNLFTNNH